MQSEFFDCSICLNRYNSIDRLPKILPGCGHTICSSCLKQILQSQHANCPLDRKPLDKSLKAVEMIPTNILILQMLDGKSQPQYANCSVHKEPKNFYCMEDKIEICKKCANEKAHHGHSVWSTSEIFSKAATKKNKLRGFLDDFEGEVHRIHALIEENKKNTLSLMRDKFAKLRDLLNKREQEISSEIDLFFTKEKLRIDTQIQHDLSLRELIRTKIANLSELEINDKLLKELNDDAPISQFSSTSQYNEIYNHSQDIQQNIENAFNNLISLAGSAFQEFKPFPEFSRPLNEFSGHQPNQKISSIIAPSSNPRNQVQMLMTIRIEVEFGWLVIYPILPEDDLVQVEKNNILNLAKGKELTRANLDFRKQKLNGYTASLIAHFWKKEFKNITTVKLLLTNREFENQDLCDLCAYNFWCSSQIETLYIYLVNTKINESGVQKLSQAIDGQNLKTFATDLSFSTFSDSCMKNLAKNFVWKLKKIESFDLKISNTSVGDSGIEEFYREFSKVMATTKRLELGLNTSGVTYKSFESLNKTVVPLGKNLTWLTISCPDYGGPEGNFIKGVVECIEKNLPKLTDLRLDFGKRGLNDETKKCIENFKKNKPNVQTNF